MGEYKPLAAWADRNKERLGFIAAAVSAGWILIPRIERLFQIEEPWLSIVAFIVTAALIVVAWFAYGALAGMATSLGYTKISAAHNIHVSGDSNVINIEPPPEQEALTERYREGDVLSPLESARLRMLDHIKKLRNNSVTNLFIGIFIA